MKYPIPESGWIRVLQDLEGGTLSTGYLLRLAKFAQEKCEGNSQVQHLPNIGKRKKGDC